MVRSPNSIQILWVELITVQILHSISGYCYPSCGYDKSSTCFKYPNLGNILPNSLHRWILGLSAATKTFPIRRVSPNLPSSSQSITYAPQKYALIVRFRWMPQVLRRDCTEVCVSSQHMMLLSISSEKKSMPGDEAFVQTAQWTVQLLASGSWNSHEHRRDYTRPRLESSCQTERANQGS